MNARVIKTGAIVNLVTKRGEYFLDDNSNPYKEEELDFDVIVNDLKPDFAPLPDFTRLFGMGISQQGVQIAIQYMQNQPNASAEKVCEFVKHVMETIRML